MSFAPAAATLELVSLRIGPNDEKGSAKSLPLSILLDADVSACVLLESSVASLSLFLPDVLA
jgi:hypothetical protein